MNPDAAKVLKDQQEKYGKKVVCVASDLPPLRRIPTGSPMLDAALGGGWALGRISEIYGFEHSGKTALALSTIALAQARHDDSYYCNCERTWDEAFSRALGVDPKEVGMSRPKTAEDGIKQILEALGSEAFQVVVLDSITVMTPSGILEKLEKEGISRTVGDKAWFNNRFVELSILKNQNSALLIINQPRVKISASKGAKHIQLPPEPGGGSGLKHLKSISVELGKGAWLGDDGTELALGSPKTRAGFVVRFKIRKNKTAPPYREGSYRFYFLAHKGGGPGIDRDFDLTRLARMHGLKAGKGKKGPTEAEIRKAGWPEGY